MRRQLAVMVLSVADARIDSFLRLAFADSYYANCKDIYEQFLSLNRIVKLLSALADGG